MYFSYIFEFSTLEALSFIFLQVLALEEMLLL